MEQGRVTLCPSLVDQRDCCEWANWGTAVKAGRETGEGEGKIVVVSYIV